MLVAVAGIAHREPNWSITSGDSTYMFNMYVRVEHSHPLPPALTRVLCGRSCGGLSGQTCNGGTDSVYQAKTGASTRYACRNQCLLTGSGCLGLCVCVCRSSAVAVRCAGQLRHVRGLGAVGYTTSPKHTLWMAVDPLWVCACMCEQTSEIRRRV